jgi:hypothetical protein
MGPFPLTLFGWGMAQLGRFADADLTEGRSIVSTIIEYGLKIARTFDATDFCSMQIMTETCVLR